MLTNQTPNEWLKFNYDLEIGGKVSINGQDQVIKNIKKTDNRGHYRTNYPVVIGIHNEDSMFPEKITWLTIESIFKF